MILELTGLTQTIHEEKPVCGEANARCRLLFFAWNGQQNGDNKCVTR